MDSENTKDNQQEIEHYWQEVQRITSELEPEGRFSTLEIIDLLNGFLKQLAPESSDIVTKPKIDYLRTQGILHPEANGGKERRNWRYTMGDVRRALFIELLKRKMELGVGEGGMWLETYGKSWTGANREEPQAGVSGSRPSTPQSSAYSLLRNRVLGILMLNLNFQISGKIPVDCLIAFRPVKSGLGISLPANPTWPQVHELLIGDKSGEWFLAASDSYSKLYLYRDLEELQERRKEISPRLEKKEEYKWYYVHLVEVNEQAYDLLLGLSLSGMDSSSAVLSAFEQTIRPVVEGVVSTIHLKEYPGLSTLLQAAFINNPEITGGTPLAALVEIIAGTSPLLDNCAIRVPKYDSNGKAISLRVQEYSLKSPLALVNKQVAIGDFLIGWSYSHNQMVVVEPAIEKDPRITFFKEENSPTAAAAIPAAASGQYVVGAIYVASHAKPTVFSDELLSCLKALGYICGDMIARDQIEIETVRSVGLPSEREQASDTRGLVTMVVDRAIRNVNPAEAARSWIYLLTLNIEADMQDTLAQWLCEQGIEFVGNFLSNRIYGQSAFPASTLPLPVGYCEIRPDRYAFAILSALDVPEAEFKQKIANLESELNLSIGDISPRLYLSVIPFRYGMLYKQRQETGESNLIDDLVNQVDERARVGLLLKRGHQYLYTARPDQAVSNFNEARRYAPNSWYAWKHLAEARMSQGTERAIEQAIDACQEAVRLKPDYASAHCLLADCLAYRGRYFEAFVHFEKAIESDSTRHDFLTRYGLTLASMTDSAYKEAIASLRTAMPELFQQYQYLPNPRDEAIACFGQARDVKLGNMDVNSSEAQEIQAEYHYQTGWVYLQAGDIDTALEEFTTGRRHSPNNLNLEQAYLNALRQRREKGT